MQTLGRRSDADPLPTCAEGRAYELGLEAVLGWPPSAGLAERRETEPSAARSSRSRPRRREPRQTSTFGRKEGLCPPPSDRAGWSESDQWLARCQQTEQRIGTPGSWAYGVLPRSGGFGRARSKECQPQPPCPPTLTSSGLSPPTTDASFSAAACRTTNPLTAATAAIPPCVVSYRLQRPSSTSPSRSPNERAEQQSPSISSDSPAPRRRSGPAAPRTRPKARAGQGSAR
jgi:hypothetical protein